MRFLTALKLICTDQFAQLDFCLADRSSKRNKVKVYKLKTIGSVLSRAELPLRSCLYVWKLHHLVYC